jgi:hypothetical protein
MPNIRQSKNALLYSLKVWLSCAILGSIYLIVSSIFQGESRFGIAMTYASGLLLSIVFSIPCFLLFWLGVSTLDRYNRRVIFKKTFTAFWGVLLFIGIFWFLFDWSTMTNLLSLSYLVPLLASILFLQWPEKGVAGEAV